MDKSASPHDDSWFSETLLPLYSDISRWDVVHSLKLHKHDYINRAARSETAAATPRCANGAAGRKEDLRDPLDTPTRLAILMIWY